MFVDRAIITVRAGDGGAGAISFRREKKAPKGGPDGGDGGAGGSVLLVAEEGLKTLYDFRGNRHWEAQPGEPGRFKQQHGANGEDRIIGLPPGTLIYNDETGGLIHDLKPGETVVVAKGGKGGWGNEHFKSSVNQTPRKNTPGEHGERFTLRFELKLIADVGFIGLPNAGKSTLLAALTRAQPKIGDYPFTTLAPQLGIAELDSERRIVLADIPGLIEGAAKGAGLGHDFLRHVERTRVLVHLLDAQPVDGSDPAANYEMIRRELAEYSSELADKRELVVLNKTDLLMDQDEIDQKLKELASKLELRPGRDIIAISGATGTGTRDLLDRLWKSLDHAPDRVEGWKAGAADA